MFQNCCGQQNISLWEHLVFAALVSPAGGEKWQPEIRLLSQTSKLMVSYEQKVLGKRHPTWGANVPKGKLTTFQDPMQPWHTIVYLHSLLLLQCDTCTIIFKNRGSMRYTTARDLKLPKYRKMRIISPPPPPSPPTPPPPNNTNTSSPTTVWRKYPFDNKVLRILACFRLRDSGERNLCKADLEKDR